MNDLIIGAADLYKGEQIRVWAKSARLSGFDGKMALIVYRVDRSVIDECMKWDVEVVEAKLDHWGNPISHDSNSRNTQSHQMRFFHIWQYLKESRDFVTVREGLNFPVFDNVVVTDVRDVCFQTNPSPYIEKRLITGARLIVSSEHLQYKNEPWGADNLKNGFGPHVYDWMKDQTIYNVGTMAGDAQFIENLSLVLYMMGVGKYIPNDQSGLNFLLNTLIEKTTFKDKTGWACQCGTIMDPTKLEKFKPHLQESPEPVVEKGFLRPATGAAPFVIVHQYDRVPELKKLIEERYL